LENSIQKELSKIEEMDVEDIENRLGIYKRLRRKYGPTTEDVLENLAAWKIEYDKKAKELEILINAVEEKRKLEKQLAELANNISKMRKDAAKELKVLSQSI